MNYLAILELTMFFVFLIYVFQNLQAVDLSKIFKKGKTGQIQIVFIMLCISLAYLLTKAIMNIINLSRLIV